MPGYRILLNEEKATVQKIDNFTALLIVLIVALDFVRSMPIALALFGFFLDKGTRRFVAAFRTNDMTAEDE